MRVLAFDTATEYLSVCLYDSREGVIAQSHRHGSLRHGAYLAPLLEEVLQHAGVSGLSGVDLLSCAGGPGSFTGLRIGFATAKGLSAATNGSLPIVAVPTLEALAERRRDRAALILPVLDGRKGRFYSALFSDTGRLSEDLDLSPSDVFSLLEGQDALVTGFHASVFLERLGDQGSFDDSLPRLTLDADATEGLAPTLARMAAEAGGNSWILKPGDGPHYVRQSDAELARKNRG